MDESREGLSIPFVFGSLDQLRELLNQNYDRWSAILTAENSRFARDVQDALDRIWAPCIEAVQQAMQAPDGERESARISALELLSKQANAGLLFSVDSAAGLFVSDLKPERAVGALAALINHNLFLDDSSGYYLTIDASHLQGYMQGFLFRMGLLDGAESTRQSLQITADRFSSVASTAESELQSLRERATEQFASIDQTAEQARAEQASAFDRLTAAHRRSLAQSLKKVRSLESQYLEKLKLDAAVEYWNKKRKAHKTWALVFGGSFLLGAIGAGYWLHEESAMLLRNATPGRVPIWELIRVGTITLLAVWVLHYFVKFSLSSAHLAADSGERATMVLTYLALLEKGAATEAERALILQSLFRPASTGLFRESSGPPGLSRLADFLPGNER